MNQKERFSQDMILELGKMPEVLLKDGNNIIAQTVSSTRVVTNSEHDDSHQAEEQHETID